VDGIAFDVEVDFVGDLGDLGGLGGLDDLVYVFCGCLDLVEDVVEEGLEGVGYCSPLSHLA
jgi:hypothetical protein